MQESERGGRIKESLEREEGKSILEVGIQSSGFEEGTVEGCFPRSRWWEEGEEEEKEEERSRGVRAMRLHASPERSYKLRNIDLNKEPPLWDTDDVSGGATGSGGGGDTIAFRGVRHRPELNKWVTEIRPTSQKRKIWLGTYETPQEAARAYDAGIFYTKKKIPYNFEDSPHHLHNQPIPPELPWDAFAALVKQKATLAAKRHRVNSLQEFATAQ